MLPQYKNRTTICVLCATEGHGLDNQNMSSLVVPHVLRKSDILRILRETALCMQNSPKGVRLLGIDEKMQM